MPEAFKYRYRICRTWEGRTIDDTDWTFDIDSIYEEYCITVGEKDYSNVSLQRQKVMEPENITLDHLRP